MTNLIGREKSIREKLPPRVFRYKSSDTMPRFKPEPSLLSLQSILCPRAYFCNTIADQAHISILSIIVIVHVFRQW